MTFYHDGMRELQDRYEGRNVADRLEAHRMRASFNDDDRALIETASFFFLATAAEDSVDCSFKGGDPGFIRITGSRELAWPDYDGNRMYRSLGNILKSSRVGLLFLRLDGHRFDGSAARLRVDGRARVLDEDVSMTDWPGAKRLNTSLSWCGTTNASWSPQRATALSKCAPMVSPSKGTCDVPLT